MQGSWNVEEDWRKRMMGFHSETVQRGFHHICRLMWADNRWRLSQSKEHLVQMMRELMTGVGRRD